METQQKALKQHYNLVEKKIKYFKLINLPATLMIGLVGYAKFASQPEILHPLLAHDSVVYGLLVIAIPWGTFCTYKLTKLKQF